MNITANFHRCASKSIVLAAVVVAAITTADSAVADAVDGMCIDSNELEKVCACASKQLRESVGEEEYALYEAVGAAYMANQASGMGMGDAWDAAVKAESSRQGKDPIKILSKTNALGQAHNKAMKQCAG